MTVQLTLNERHQEILRATIKHYIATAEPVGSKTLIEEYDFSVSSATIRSAMGKLEKAGLLYQPHTSAGRIPSDSGYRIYVDRLLTWDLGLKSKIEDLFSRHLNDKNWSCEALFQKIAQILAHVSGCIALITFPRKLNNILNHLQLLRIASNQIMLILVIDTYQTQSILLDNHDFPQGGEGGSFAYIDDRLQILSNFLNSKLKGRSLAELSNLDWSELDREFREYNSFIKALLAEIQGICNLSRYSSICTPIIIKGISEMLRQPEFSAIEPVRMLLHLLEKEQEQLFPLIFNLSDNDPNWQKVTIKIGSENHLESMRPCSLISALYHQGDSATGSVGIIGPTRMAYENAIALVESTADYLSESLS